MSERSGGENSYLLVPILLVAILLALAVIRGPQLISMSGIGASIIVAAPLILATYALMATTIAGRGTIDLAVGPLMAFINVLIVRLYGLGVISSPIEVFAFALGVGILYQVIFALIIIFVRVQPIIVSLSGFIALSGINLVILPRPGGTAPDWMAGWGLGVTIFTPVLLIVLLATGGWLLFTATAFYSNLRMMGYDERAAYTSGVRIYLVRIGAHVISGIFVALSAICYTALIASGDPTQGAIMTLSAITAVVLGGVALSGGRGSIIGALLGATTLYLIGYVLTTFHFGAIQSFAQQLVYGVILVLSLLLSLLAPVIARHISFITPYGAFVVLAVVVGAIALQTATYQDYVSSNASIAPSPEARRQTTADAGARLTGNEKEHTSGFVDRYFILPRPVGGAIDAIRFGDTGLTSTQKFAFATAGVLVLVTLVLRALVAEAISLRLGLFLYIFIGALVVLVFFSLVVSGDGASTPEVGPQSTNERMLS